MGKQSKLKQKRQDLKNNPPEVLPVKEDLDPTHFVETMEKQGYQLKTSNSCPNLPQIEDGKPQL
ncbi:hypothetical protein [Planktothrix sp. FACHB-1365]|uniref:hypothetical protein n=1 Tax=Planktothrix sp. FACHB-1365 TaxID=2692855 RepID=UPI0016835279|nr:hypothetical protein [Planktothrix sp. FACHB-1365]MBD2484396.1 hypothetical protein [Planktothrix sp. FACHB-1365]